MARGGSNGGGVGDEVGTFDYVVVGAGTAGCVLANRLSADPRASVLLLEAGGKDNWIWIHIPIGYLYTQNNPRTDWCFRTEPEPGLNGRALNYPRGRVLGGCSSINGMIYMRGQARDYDGWRQQGNRGWGWDDVLPYFKKSEDHAAGADEMHGAGGEWRIEQQRLSWEILDAFREAAAEIGIPKITDFNRGNNEGCAYFQVTQRRGVRWSTAKAFLRPTKGRPNLTVLTGAQATGIVFAGRRAVGLRFSKTAGRSSRGRAARCCWRAVRSARRSSCSSRAWARRRSCRSWAFRSCMRRTASAPTSRTTCRSARCTGSSTPAP